jgi:hypothetical protein
VNTMTEAELAAIEARASKASPGPWRVVTHFNAGATVATIRSTTELDVETGGCFACESKGPTADPWQDGGSNAAFIAASREEVPRLVAEVRRLRALLDGIANDLELEACVRGDSIGGDEGESLVLEVGVMADGIRDMLKTGRPWRSP